MRRLAIGRMDPKKGFNMLIRAAQLLREKGEPFFITIVGDGPERARLEQEIRRWGLGRWIHMAGTLSNEEVFGHLVDAHALVAPSIQDRAGDLDGIPNVVIEAMAMGRPVVGSRLSGIPEVVHHHRTGLLVPPGEPEALAAAMAHLAQDRARLSNMGMQAKALVEERFDVRANVATQLSILDASLEATERDDG